MLYFDKRIVEYANDIISDGNEIATHGVNQTAPQRKYVSIISNAAERLISTNTLYESQSLPTEEIARMELMQLVRHDLLMPISLMIGYCDVLEQIEDLSGWSEHEIATLKHIRNHITMIHDIVIGF